MEITNIANVKTREEWRKWLKKNHAKEAFCWVKTVRGAWGAHSKDGVGIPYLDAVEEALCFGWIDSTSKGGFQRFSPRRKNGNWTQLNIARCERLQTLGLMTDAGLAVMPKTPFEVASHVIEALQADAKVWENYLKQPEIYQRVRIDNIQNWYGNDDETYKRRLEKFIENTRLGKLYGEWHDGGRLHDIET